MGQIYAVESVACSVIMYVGVTLYSPMLSVALYIGSLLASICGIIFTIFNLSERLRLEKETYVCNT